VCAEPGGGRGGTLDSSSCHVRLSRADFLALLTECVATIKPSLGPGLHDDLEVLQALESKSVAVAILLCGATGSGKSTLGALLSSSLGIHTILSTDSVRNSLRSLTSSVTSDVDIKTKAILARSTYDAYEALLDLPSVMPHEKKVVKGYKAQAAIVMEHTSEIITRTLSRGQSLIVEGIHLRPQLIVQMMARRPDLIILPFSIRINDPEKHISRFAVRAKHLALQPVENRYVHYFREIRAIQGYLSFASGKHQIPTVDNSSADRSLAAIRRTVLQCTKYVMSCRRRMTVANQIDTAKHNPLEGPPRPSAPAALNVGLVNVSLLTVPVLQHEFESSRADRWKHKSMLVELSAASQAKRENRPLQKPISSASCNDTISPGKRLNLDGAIDHASPCAPEMVTGERTSPLIESLVRQLGDDQALHIEDPSPLGAQDGWTSPSKSMSQTTVELSSSHVSHEYTDSEDDWLSRSNSVASDDGKPPSSSSSISAAAAVSDKLKAIALPASRVASWVEAWVPVGGFSHGSPSPHFPAPAPRRDANSDIHVLSTRIRGWDGIDPVLPRQDTFEDESDWEGSDSGSLVDDEHS